VKFEQIGIQRFGPLGPLAWGDEQPLASLVAVHGPNEAGKSAFHQILASLLYGFYPASREGNPWSPWDGEDADIQARIRLRDGGDLTVHRRLLSTPWGQVQRGEAVEQLRNDDLSVVRHVQRDVFLQVYALALSDLAGLEGRGWDAVQDRLLVGMGTDDIRPPREVIRAWSRAAQELWRADRRGMPRHRRIRERLRELRTEQREAVDRDRELRAALSRSEELAEERERLRLRRSELNELLDGARRLRPLQNRLKRLDELRTRAGDGDRLKHLPADPGERLAELSRRIQEEEGSLSRLDDRIDRVRERTEAVGEADRAILERGPELRELAGRASLLQERAARRGELDEEIRGLERRIRETASPLFEDGAPPPSARVLEALSIPELERRVSEAGRSRERAERTRDRIEVLEDHSPGEGPGWLVPAGLLLLPVGLALVIFALLVRDTDLEVPGVVLGVLLSAAGLWMLQQGRAARARKLREGEAAALRRALKEAEGELEEALAAVRSVLRELPIREEIRDDPTPTVVAALARLRELLQDLGDRQAARDALERGDREVSQRLDRVRHDLLPDLPSDPVAALPELRRRLGEVDRLAEEARSAERELEDLSRDRKPLEDKVEGLRAELTALREAVAAAAGGGDPEAPETLEKVDARLRAMADLRRAEEALPVEFPDLEELRERLEEAEREGAAWLEEQDLTGLEAECEAVQERMEDLRAELAGQKERAENLSKGATADLLGGEIEILEQELVEVRRERDRMHVLARLVLRAEQRFREEHQPDLLRRAGDYLSRITGERYPRLIVEAGDNGSTFHLEARHLPHSLPVAPPLSTGTREQVYLALRLAIIDHLDEGREPLPLFLDEVLVNWDAGRRSRGMDILAEVARERQVFLFTCHPGLAREVVERGGDVLALEGPEADG